MRVFVIHDAKGNIRSFAVPAPAMPDQKLEPPRGWIVSEIEVAGFDQINAQPREQLRQLSEALKNQLVRRARGQATLVPRRAGKKR